MSDPLLDLLRHFEGWHRREGTRLKLLLAAIYERQQRLTEDRALPGDSFGVLRRLLILSSHIGTPSDFVWLAVELGRFDEEAMLPYQLKFVERRPTQGQKRLAAETARAARLVNRDRRDRAIFNRILDHQAKTSSTLEQALVAVANGDDGPLGILRVQPPRYSVSLVRAIFMKHIAEAKRTGTVQRPSGMFGGTLVTSPMPARRPKGRPKT